jgi:toxin ParE1/3/4
VRASRVVFSELAVADILAQAEWYELQAGQKLANRWEQAVSAGVLRLVRMPRAGALCEFKPEALRDIRRLPITGFPAHLIFYKLRNDQIHILRVVHGARDLERLLAS